MYITIMFLHKHVTHMLIPDTLILDLDTQALILVEPVYPNQYWCLLKINTLPQQALGQVR